MNFILDVDTGEDDALAILVALSAQLPLKYVFTSYGNTSLDLATKNTADVLELGEASHVTIVQGSKGPIYPHLVEENVSAGDFVGVNGLCGVTLPSAKSILIEQPRPADLNLRLAEIVRKQAPVTYIVTGPCTNLAKVCSELGKDVRKFIDTVYIMGGSFWTPGNSGPKDLISGAQIAEFNFYCDPFAANLVLNSGLNIKLVSWDTTSALTISPQRLLNLSAIDKRGQFTIDLISAFLSSYGNSNNRHFELNDPVTVMAALKKCNFYDAQVSVSNELKDFGRTTIDPYGVKVKIMRTDSDSEREQLIGDILGLLGISYLI